MHYPSKNKMFLRLSKAHGAIDIWCIHAFGESGQSYDEIFDSTLIKHDIYIPDLPGFGQSVYDKTIKTLEPTAAALYELIQKISTHKPIILITHSMGAIIGVLLAEMLKSQICGFINIEGFLVEEEFRYSYQVDHYPNAKFYKQYIYESVAAIANNEPLARYLVSLRIADERALYGWAKSCKLIAKGISIGQRYKKINCEKIYFAGKKSLTEKTLTFLKKNNLKYKIFQTGHWVMEESKKCYQEIDSFITALRISAIENNDGH